MSWRTREVDNSVTVGRISQEVVDISKSLEFTQEQLDEELAKLKNDVGKIQIDIKDYSSIF